MSAGVSTIKCAVSHWAADQAATIGAAASFAAMLLWLYYSAQIFLLGAAFTACIGGVRDARSPKARRQAVNHATQK